MQIQFGATYWGSEKFSAAAFVENLLAAGYDGLELFLQANQPITEDFLQAIEIIRKEKPEFFFILLHLPLTPQETPEEHIKVMETNLQFLSAWQPLFINSHTGKDYFSFDDNCRIIESAMNFSAKSGVKILHETHRGRFSFHASTLLPYLKRFPEMELVGDFSHFCTVSESMLDDQVHILHEIIPHVAHIHARVGYEQGPQVNDPSAPEWQGHLEKFMGWWGQVIEYRKNKNSELLTITPEFGPAPYMPRMPFVQTDLSDQWNNNLLMMEKIKQRFIQ